MRIQRLEIVADNPCHLLQLDPHRNKTKSRFRLTNGRMCKYSLIVLLTVKEQRCVTAAIARVFERLNLNVQGIFRVEGGISQFASQHSADLERAEELDRARRFCRLTNLLLSSGPPLLIRLSDVGCRLTGQSAVVEQSYLRRRNGCCAQIEAVGRRHTLPHRQEFSPSYQRPGTVNISLGDRQRPFVPRSFSVS
jgi:hypothetical protein